jgi:hypothetical protein
MILFFEGGDHGASEDIPGYAAVATLELGGSTPRAGRLSSAADFR